jgi:hypothetical protein
MPISAQNLYRMAGQLAEEHGELALDYTRRAYRTLETRGSTDRARIWFMLSIIVDDMALYRLDPDSIPTIH